MTVFVRVDAGPSAGNERFAAFIARITSECVELVELNELTPTEVAAGLCGAIAYIGHQYQHPTAKNAETLDSLVKLLRATFNDIQIVKAPILMPNPQGGNA